MDEQERAEIISEQIKSAYNSVLSGFLLAIGSVRDHNEILMDGLEKVANDFVALLASDDVYQRAFVILRDSFYQKPLQFVSHSVNVATLSFFLGRNYLTAEQGRDLFLAGLLHHVGLLKKHDLSDLQSSKCFYDILSGQDLNQAVGLDIVKIYYFKNNLTMSSYLFQILQANRQIEESGKAFTASSDNKIRSSADMVRLASLFVLLLADGLNSYQAIQVVIEKHGRGFDPKIIRGLLNAIPMFPVGDWVDLSDGTKARVVTINQERPVRPIVDVIIDKSGNKFLKPLRINLREEPLLYITKPCENPEKGPG